MEGRQRPTAAGKSVQPLQAELQWNLESAAAWIGRLQQPKRVRQLLEALLRFGWSKRHERFDPDGCFDSAEEPELFVGEWHILAGKTDLRLALKSKPALSTMKRILKSVPEAGLPPLLSIDRRRKGGRECHLYVVDLTEIRTADVAPAVNVDRGHGPGSRAGEPGSWTGVTGEFPPPHTISPRLIDQSIDQSLPDGEDGATDRSTDACCAQNNELPALPADVYDAELDDRGLYAVLREWWQAHQLGDAGFDPNAVFGAVLAARDHAAANMQRYVVACLRRGVGENWQSRAAALRKRCKADAASKASSYETYSGHGLPE